MRLYETLVLFAPGLQEEEREEQLAKLRSFIGGAGGAVTAINIWG